MANKQKQLAQLLEQFYRQPIAKVSLELLLTIGSVIFLAVFAIQPTLVTMSDLVKEIEEKKVVNQKLSQKVAALASAQSEFLSLKPQIELLDQALPTVPNIVYDLKLIEKMASENSILITGLNMPELPPEEAPINSKDLERQSTPVTVTAQGDYLSIRNFVEQLKNSRRSVSVNSVVFSLKNARGKSSLTANITLDLPYFGKAK